MKLTGRLPEFLEFYLLIAAIIAGQLIKFPLGLGGITLLDITVLILCAFGLLKIKFKFKTPPSFIKSVIFFIFIAGISLLLTPIDLTQVNFLSSSFYLIRFCLYIFLGYLIYLNAFPLLKEKLSEVLLLSGLGLALLGLLQFIFIPNLLFLKSSGWDPHFFRTVSSFLDPNFAGASFVLTLILIYKAKLQIKVKYIFLGIVFIALLTTFSRSSYLMFLVSSLSLALLERSKKLILITLIAFITLIASFYLYGQLISKPRGIDRKESASFRLNTWQQGLTLFKEHPILGVGFNTYKFAIEEEGLANQQFLNSRGATSNDSSLLFVAATTGIVGLLCYLYFLIKVAQISPILTSVIAGLLAHSFFANSLFYPFILIWIITQASSDKDYVAS